MTKPLILKEQVASIIIIIVMLMIMIMQEIRPLADIFFYFLIIILTYTTLPIIRSYLKYTHHIHIYIYAFVHILPVFFISISAININNKLGIIYGISIGILLNITNYEYVKECFSDKNPRVLQPITVLSFCTLIFSFIFSVIIEEYFFRYFIIGHAAGYIGFYSIILSAALFVMGHFTGRWSRERFGFKSYVYHFVTGLLFGCIFFFYHSIYGCIIAHYLFNLPNLVIIVKRFKNRNKVKAFTFDDY